jgi:hypothetical protein
MHRVQGHNPPFDQGGRDERFKRADLILLLADITLPEHRSRCDVVATEQMNGMGLRAGRAKGFPINGEVGMIEMALAGLCAG